MITLADGVPGDEDKIAALLAELALFYGGSPEGTPAERSAVVRGALFGEPPLGYVLLAWDGLDLAGMAAYSFLWPAAGLACIEMAPASRVRCWVMVASRSACRACGARSAW